MPAGAVEFAAIVLPVEFFEDVEGVDGILGKQEPVVRIQRQQHFGLEGLQALLDGMANVSFLTSSSDAQLGTVI